MVISFLSDLAYFASWYQCCRYIPLSTEHTQQNSENTYNYYIELAWGLLGVYSAFSFKI